MAIARERAQIMATNNNMSHYSPSGETVFTIMSRVGYAYGFAAENIHYNVGFGELQSAEEAMKGWINSPSHHTNVVDRNFRRMGIGIATGSGGGIYYAVVFSD
jgi:uncharacterized protein YkwD